MSRSAARFGIVRLEHAEIPVAQLELDPDNPRIRYRLGINPGTDAKQELLGWRDVNLLRKDIERSGGLRERIVVQFNRQSKTYKVKEGNCRTVCYTSLHEKDPGNKRWQRVPAKVLPENVDPRAVAILLADWQVVGKIEWKAHEKAAQVYRMHSKLKMSMDEIAMHMRASKTTIQRQLDAHRALTERFLCSTTVATLRTARGSGALSTSFSNPENSAAARRRTRTSLATFVAGLVRAGCDKVPTFGC